MTNQSHNQNHKYNNTEILEDMQELGKEREQLDYIAWKALEREDNGKQCHIELIEYLRKYYLREAKENIDCDKSKNLIRCAEKISAFTNYYFGFYRIIDENKGRFEDINPDVQNAMRRLLSDGVSFNNMLVARTVDRSKSILKNIRLFGSHLIEKCPDIEYYFMMIEKQDGYSSEKCDKQTITGFENLNMCADTMTVYKIHIKDIGICKIGEIFCLPELSAFTSERISIRDIENYRIMKCNEQRQKLEEGLKYLKKNAGQGENKARKCQKELKEYAQGLAIYAHRLIEESLTSTRPIDVEEMIADSVDCTKSQRLIECADDIFPFVEYYYSLQKIINEYMKLPLNHGIYGYIKPPFNDDICFDMQDDALRILNQAVKFNNGLVRRTAARSKQVFRNVLGVYGISIVEKCSDIIMYVKMQTSIYYGSHVRCKNPITGFKDLDMCMDTLNLLNGPLEDIGDDCEVYLPKFTCTPSNRNAIIPTLALKDVPRIIEEVKNDLNPYDDPYFAFNCRPPDNILYSPEYAGTSILTQVMDAIGNVTSCMQML